MKSNKKVIGIALLIAILIIGVGFAAITNITLTIKGDATGKTNQDNFKVKFTGDPVVSSADNVTATVDGDLVASIDVHNLTAKGDKETATYTIKNESPDLTAALTAEVVQNNNQEYFKVTKELAKDKIAKNEETTITVTVELIKTPIQTDVNTDIIVTVTAAPEHPESTPVEPAA